MIKSIQLKNLFALARVQEQGHVLDLEERLVQPRSPLGSALLTTVLPTVPRTSTYVLEFSDDHQRYQGVIQARNRTGRPEQDIVFVAPTLAYGNGTHAAWQRLLTHACVKAGEAGHQRIYARFEQGGDELQIFKNVGFAAYAKEHLYQLLAPDFPAELEDSLGLRKQKNADSWSLQRLYAAVTPRTVQMAEGLAQGQWQVNNPAFSDQGRRYGYVWEREGEILAVAHIRAGKAGTWLRIMIHPDARERTRELLSGVLSIIKGRRSRSRRPIYASLRSYQLELNNALLDYGFRKMTTQVVTVKHTTVRSKDFLSRIVAAFEGPVEATRVTQTPFVNSDKVPSRPRNGEITVNTG